VASRTAAGTGCPVCGLKSRARTQSRVPLARSLAVRDPAVAAELHPDRNPGIDPRAAGSTLNPQTLVELRDLRPRVEDRRFRAYRRLRLPRLLSRKPGRSPLLSS
jgi:hypothetical protein